MCDVDLGDCGQHNPFHAGKQIQLGSLVFGASCWAARGTAKPSSPTKPAAFAARSAGVSTPPAGRANTTTRTFCRLVNGRFRSNWRWKSCASGSPPISPEDGIQIAFDRLSRVEQLGILRPTSGEGLPQRGGPEPREVSLFPAGLSDNPIVGRDRPAERAVTEHTSRPQGPSGRVRVVG